MIFFVGTLTQTLTLAFFFFCRLFASNFDLGVFFFFFRSLFQFCFWIFFFYVFFLVFFFFFVGTLTQTLTLEFFLFCRLFASNFDLGVFFFFCRSSFQF